MITKIEIENLKCNGCANTIKKTLSKMNGIKNVKVNFEPESVEVEFDESLTKREDFVQQLSKLGYPEKGNNTLIKNVKSYISCAIGRTTKEEKK